MDEFRDEELVHQNLDVADDGAFEILYHRYEGPLLSFFYRRVGNWETAQDLVQETFIKVHQNLSTLRDPKSFSSWLYSIAHQLIAAHFRENKRKLEIGSLEGNPEAYLVDLEHRSPIYRIIAKEQMEIVYALAQRLPISEQEVFEMKLENPKMMLEEIAEKLEITLSATKVRLHRAKKKVVAWMKAEYPGEFDHIFGKQEDAKTG
ncbi:MAG: sigma-70 family RNA polymerase sigma factor [Candidatus Poribacteria bacterium]|nr:sigma-70 family RNA polymerase sigma factor [Candidatus Poribacteria bacterium]